MKSVSLDTQMLIFALQAFRNPPPPAQKGLIERCGELIRLCDSERIPVMIAAPVLGEFLAGYPADEQGTQFKRFIRKFRVLPFDYRAARIAASLYERTAVKEVIASGIPKQKVKVDLQILSICMSEKVGSLYVSDQHFERWKQDVVKVCGEADLPVPAKPRKESRLFEEE